MSVCLAQHYDNSISGYAHVPGANPGCLAQGLDLTDEAAVARLAQDLKLEILPAGDHTDGRHYTVMLDGQDVTWDIRLPEVDAAVYLVSSYSDVRQEMVRRQRDYAHRGSVIMVGRDIGTVVIPNAPLKLYITATAAERAQRRWVDRQRQGHPDDYESILADVERRDAIDSSRSHSPLRPATDAVMVDTTGRDVDDVVADLIQRIDAVVEAAHGAI
ncbi:MAG: (d)CMP kinase [Chloroflexota bacterium]